MSRDLLRQDPKADGHRVLIEARRANPIGVMAKLLGVSRSDFYTWPGRGWDDPRAVAGGAHGCREALGGCLDARMVRMGFAVRGIVHTPCCVRKIIQELGVRGVVQNARRATAEISSDNPVLMRNIRRHEHVLGRTVAEVCRAVMAVIRNLGVELPDKGDARVNSDDSIITDTNAEKRQDIAKAAVGLKLSDEY